MAKKVPAIRVAGARVKGCEYVTAVLKRRTVYHRDGEPIYYHGLHELWNIAGCPQKKN